MNSPEERPRIDATRTGRPVGEGERPEPGSRGKKPVLKKKKPFPWLLLAVFLASVYYFWVWPQMRGDQPVEVEVTNSK